MNTTSLNTYIEQGMDYAAYLELVETRFAKGETTSGHTSESMLSYTRLNLQRMKRLGKTARLQPPLLTLLQHLQTPYLFLVLTEGWCGDAAQIIPYLHAMEQVTPNLRMKLLLRDEHPALMDAYLTAGGRSIPKVIVLNETTQQEVGTWGPRPTVAQEMVMKNKYAAEPKPFSEFSKELQTWYTRNKGLELQHEWVSLFEQWEA